MSYKYVTSIDSPNYGYNPSGSKGGNNVKEIIIHHWGNEGQKFYNVANYLCKSSVRASAHYILQDGLVACIVDRSNCAWHAGNKSVNCSSIGIECRPECTTGDVNTLVQLIANLYHIYGIIPIRGHKDVVATACPGKYYSKIPSIKTRAIALYKSGNTIEEIKPTTVTPKATSDKLAVDGMFYSASVRAAQSWINTPADGVVSNQLNVSKPYLYAIAPVCEFSNNTNGGSLFVRAIQKLVGAVVDGYMGFNTVTKLQIWLNNHHEKEDKITVDGYFGTDTAKSFQSLLNITIK